MVKLIRKDICASVIKYEIDLHVLTWKNLIGKIKFRTLPILFSFKNINVHLKSLRRRRNMHSELLTVVILTICCCSAAKSRPTLCDPTVCSTPGFPVLHHLLEFVQTHVRWVGDAIQASCPLLPPSPPALNPSRHCVWLLVIILPKNAEVLNLEKGDTV